VDLGAGPDEIGPGRSLSPALNADGCEGVGEVEAVGHGEPHWLYGGRLLRPQMGRQLVAVIGERMFEGVGDLVHRARQRLRLRAALLVQQLDHAGEMLAQTWLQDRFELVGKAAEGSTVHPSPLAALGFQPRDDRREQSARVRRSRV
jgi:hypothetical protein